MSGKIDHGGQAFPFDYVIPAGDNLPDGSRSDLNQRYISNGMSLRDWVAGQALAGLMANPNHTLRFVPDDDAGYCVKVADALIAALKGGAA